MDKDISFGLAVLREEYKMRRSYVVNGNLIPSRIDNVIADLETIQASITKIERAFEVPSEESK